MDTNQEMGGSAVPANTFGGSSVGSVSEIRDAFMNNPAALEERYNVNKQLVDLLALQAIKTQQQSIANQMMMDLNQQAMANGQGANIAQQTEQEVVDITSNNITSAADNAGLGGIINERNAEMAAASGGMLRGRGLEHIPSNIQPYSSGGIIAFANGTEDDVVRKSAGENIDMFEILLDSEGVSDPQERGFLKAIYAQESSSGTDPAIWEGEEYKDTGAEPMGGMQVSDIAFQDIDNEGLDRTSVVGNLVAGIRYGRKMYDKADGDPALAAAGYYGGPDSIDIVRSGGGDRLDSDQPDFPTLVGYGEDIVSRMDGDLQSEAGVAQQVADAREANLLEKGANQRAEEAQDVMAQYGLSGYTPPGVMNDGSHLREIGKYPRGTVGKSGEELLLGVSETMGLTTPADAELKRREFEKNNQQRDAAWEETVRQGETPDSVEDILEAITMRDSPNKDITTEMYDMRNMDGKSTPTEPTNVDKLKSVTMGQADTFNPPEGTGGIASGTGIDWLRLQNALAGGAGQTTKSGALGAVGGADVGYQLGQQKLEQDALLAELTADVRRDIAVMQTDLGYAQVAQRAADVARTVNSRLMGQIITQNTQFNEAERKAADDAWDKYQDNPNHLMFMAQLDQLDPAARDAAYANYVRKHYEAYTRGRGFGLDAMSGGGGNIPQVASGGTTISNSPSGT